MQSTYLSGIIAKQNGATPASIVFIDIVNYSRRKTVRQQDVIRRFTDHTRQAFQILINTPEFRKLIKKHDISSSSPGLPQESDIIKISTGDGAAFAFPYPFNILNGLHLELARIFHALLIEERAYINCRDFMANNWCDCHTLYDVRIGISSGNVIVYVDLNGNFNVAGTAINDASRVMNLANPQQILLTKNTYVELHEMNRDRIADNFEYVDIVEVKHGRKIEFMRYVGPEFALPKASRA